jgi:hypothetical protein
MLVLFLTAALLAGFAAPAAAQSPTDEILLARSLRTTFAPDLAAEFLEKPASSPTGVWKTAVAIERSRAMREYAIKVGGAYADMLIESAQRELESQLHEADGRSFEPWIRFELARLVGAEGCLQLARRTRSGSRASATETKQLRDKLKHAARMLDACAAPPPTENGTLLAVDEGEFAARLALERGCNSLNQATVSTGPESTAERGGALRRAITEFDGLARKDPSSPLSWEAAAWLHRCYLENDDAKAAKKTQTDVAGSKYKAAEGGKRLLKALRLLWLIRENDIRAQATIQAECEDWLRQYPEAHDSREGWELRQFLARAAFTTVASLNPKTGISTKQREALERAWHFCTDVDLPERDEAGLARQRRLHIARSLYPELSKPLEKQPLSPHDGWLRAHMALAAIQENAAKAQPDGQRAVLSELRGLLTKVLALPDISRFPRESLECKQLLTYALFMSGELLLAAEEGEALARKNTRSVTAAQAGNMALQALATLMAPAVGQTPAPEKLRALRSRFFALAEFMSTTWKGHPQIDITRHLVSLLLSREKQYSQALDQIEALSPGYAELPRALYQGASLALEARKEQAQAAASYRERAVRFLERMPADVRGRDARSLQTIFAGKRLLVELYLQAKQWALLERVVEETVRSFQDLEESARAEFRGPLFALQLFSKSIAADQACRSGKYHDGRLALEPAATLMRDPGNLSLLEELKLREPAVLGRFFDLSIRTAVLDDAPELAKEQLELLTKLFPENPLDLLAGAMKALSEQISTLRRQGEPAKDLLAKTSASVAHFLDSLAAQQTGNARPESLLFLAESYAAIDQFARAGELASRISPPAADKPDDARAQQVYRSAQVLTLRALRKAKEWKQAETLLESLLAQPWGPSSIDLKKERLFLLQDQGKYAGKQGAVLGWNSFMMQLQPRLQDNRMRELYFDGYFQLTYCIYQNALAHTDTSAKQKDLRLAANYILKLETQPDPAAEPCKKRLEELLADAPALRNAYDSLKKTERK